MVPTGQLSFKLPLPHAAGLWPLVARLARWWNGVGWWEMPSRRDPTWYSKALEFKCEIRSKLKPPFKRLSITYHQITIVFTHLSGMKSPVPKCSNWCSHHVATNHCIHTPASRRQCSLTTGKATFVLKYWHGFFWKNSFEIQTFLWSCFATTKLMEFSQIFP